MTERLYYADAYLARFDATVLERADDGRRLYLDRSAFYPTSGGQPNDLGQLGGVRVLDVVDEGARVAHVLEAPLLADRVTGEVDWARRWDLMQQHTGQHLLSAVFADRCGWQTASVHFGADVSTLDLEVGAIDAATLARVEAEANAVLQEDRPVTVSFEDAATAQGLRKASDRTGTLRIVTIADLDRSACGGTHVRRTGEIGVILLRRLERVKKLVRVEFVCGSRAVARARRDLDALAEVAGRFSASLDDAPALVARQADALREALAAQKGLLAEVAGQRVRARLADVAPDVAGVRRVVLRVPRAGDDLRAEAQAVSALPEAATFLVAADEPPTVVLAASPASGVDAGAVLKAALAAVNGRGGGSPRLAQGTVPGRDALDRVLQALVS
ncbi:MAG TPA: alanyl-tRNA editing protein [Gemmatimonadales bacterium]|nr:alanyl-tRNA editing protein [Gemmatimonadales bacterium]